MKKIPFLSALLLLSWTVYAQPKPGKPAFIVTYEESGKNANASWNYSATVKFSLSNWNNWFYENDYKVPDKKQLIDFDPALFLKLDPETVIKFYPSEVDESGGSGAADGAHYTRVLTPDGTETVVEKDGMGDRTIITTEADFRKKLGMTANGSAYTLNARYYRIDELAELERTETGAILRAYTSVGDNLGEWAVSQETMEQVFPEVITFVLTDQDIKAWQQISRTNVASGSGEDEHLTVKLSVKMEVPDLEEPEVTLEGCSDIGIGELGQLTALGKPEGGSYRYWAEPSDVLTLEADGGSVTLEGASPGRATIFVEYSSPKGSTAQATKTASCVEVDSYNNGQPVPQVAFYDFNGKHLTGINIPVSMQPSDGADLLKYFPADPAILTVIGLGNEVTIQGIREGKTTFQATTLCGGPTGPPVDVEVVNCDDETIAKLNEQAQIANEMLKELRYKMDELVNSDEYKTAHGRILESAANLALKTSTLIIGTLGGLPGADKTVTTASKISGLGSGLLDLLRSSNDVEQAVNMVKMSIEVFGENIHQGVSGTLEALEAAQNFGDDLGVMEKAAQKTAGFYNSLDQLNRIIDNLAYRMRLCAGDPEQGASQEEPAGKHAQAPDDNAPQTGKPPVKEPTSEEPAGEEPTGQEPGDDGGEVTPPPPTGEPKQVSLPYMPAGECGCNTPKGIGLSQEGFLSLQAGMKNLGECVGNFSKGPLTDYIKTLEEWKSVTDSLAIAVTSGPNELQVAAKETIPRIESLLQLTQSFDEAGKAFIGEFNGCPESMNSVMEVLRTAETVTVDSITTKY